MERTIKRSDLDRLIKLAQGYELYPEYIDAYNIDVNQVRADNKRREEEFTEIVNKYTGSTIRHFIDTVIKYDCDGSQYDEPLRNGIIKYLGNVYDDVHREG